MILGVSLTALWIFHALASRQAWVRQDLRRSWWLHRLTLTAGFLVVLAIFTGPSFGFPLAYIGEWIQAIGLSIGCLAVGVSLLMWFWRVVPVDVGKRRFLRATSQASYVAPALVIGYGAFIERNQLRAREVRIAIPDLPKDLQGLRIAQVTDIHMSAFFSRRDLERVVAMTNESKPHLIAVTGDLITRAGDPLDDCIQTLRGLKADSGVFGCLGNHEIYADAEAYVTQECSRYGIRFLRQQALLLPFGDSRINLLGYDYQRSKQPMLVGAERLLVHQPETLNILLSHNPNAFERARDLRIPLTLAGHTHGGQVTVEYLEQTLNVARFATRYVNGHYEENGAQLYVCPGLGTVGIPLRIQVPPEVTIFQLCAR